LVDALGERIRDGRLSAGDKLPTEAEVMAEFGVSRTVVREAISKLQAAGMVETRHGIGTFVVGPGDASAFRIEPQQLAAARRGGGAGAAHRRRERGRLGGAARTAANLAAMRAALAAFAAAVEEGATRWRPTSAAQRDRARHAERALRRPDGHAGRADHSARAARGFRRDRPAAPGLPAARQRRAREHLDAIAAKDADAARAAMRTHLANSRSGGAAPSPRPPVTLSRFALNRLPLSCTMTYNLNPQPAPTEPS
jgi:DNA-binding FadR family transcriptional regulator